MGNRKFWQAQIIGWGIFTFANMGIQIFANGYDVMLVVLILLLGMVLILISGAFRSFIKRKHWSERSPKELILPVSLATIFISIIGSVVVLLLIVLMNAISNGDIPITFSTFIGNFININLLFFMWSATYFAYQYFQKYNKVQVEKLQLQLEVKEAELGILKAQINPHFMFNALNNIRALILENQEQARVMLTHLADILRYSLSYTKSEQVSLESELEIVKYYFELAAIQYESRLRYSIEVADDLRQVKIPPMLIQLLVENGIKHGVSMLPNGGEIAVKVIKKEGTLNIQVINSGRLDQKNKAVDKLGIGLVNIRERLKLLYHNKAKFDIYQQGENVLAEVILPI